MTRRFGGTRLGLAIASTLVSPMGGRICVDSEPGGGSTPDFTVRLEGAASAPGAGTSSADRPAAPPVRASRILHDAIEQ